MSQRPEQAEVYLLDLPLHEAALRRLGKWWMGRRQCERPRSSTSAVGYIRVSTEEQMLGPEAQRAALLRWAEVRGLQLVAVHEDRGLSGAAPLDRRPGLLAALDSLEQHGAAYLVAAKRDRFARDVILAAQLRHGLHRRPLLAQLGAARGLLGEREHPVHAPVARRGPGVGLASGAVARSC